MVQVDTFLSFERYSLFVFMSIHVCGFVTNGATVDSSGIGKQKPYILRTHEIGKGKPC